MSITIDSGITILRNVTSLNGLGGAISLTSSDGSIVITPSGSTINLSATAALGAYIKKDGTTITTASIPFAQGISISGGAINLQLPNANVYNLTRTIPTTVSDAVDIGSFTLTNGSGNFEIWINVPSSGYSQSKRYFIPASYDGTAGAWQKVCAASTTGPYILTAPNQDADLEIKSNLAVTSFRVRRTAGTTAGTAQIMIIHEGTITDAFTPSTSTSSVAAVTVTYRVFSDQLQVLSTPGDLGSYSLANWNSTNVSIPAFLKSPSVSGTSGGAGISPTEPALVLGRSGIASTTYPNFAEFKIGRFANVGAQARTQLDIALTNGNGDAAGTNILSLRSTGLIGANTSAPVAGFTTSQASGSTLSVVPIAIVGTATDTSSDATGGIAIYMTHNGSGNRQCVIAATENVGNDSSAGFRFLSGGGIANIDGISGGGTFRLPCNFGTDTSDVSVGNSGLAYNSALRGKLDVTTEATKVGLVIGSVSGGTTQSSDFFRVINTAGTTLTKIDSSGVTTAPNFVSTVATGTQPHACTSTTLNTNLNSDKWDNTDLVTTISVGQVLYGSGANQVSGLGTPAKGSYYLGIVGTTVSWNLFPSTTVPSWNTVLNAGRTTTGVNPQLTTTDHFEIRDANNYIGSSGTDIIDIVGKGVINLTPQTGVAISKTITTYNAVATTGWGVPAIYASGRSTAQTAAVASVATYTVGVADGSFEVSANVLVTTATLHSFTATIAYTDEGNTARTVTMQFSTLAGAFVTAMTNAQGTVPYEGVPLHIRCKASTAITIATTGTFTTVTYNVEGSIRQIA